MYEITYLVFIRYRGPFGISIPLPRLRTAHVARPLKPFCRFSLEAVWTIPASNKGAAARAGDSAFHWFGHSAALGSVEPP